MLPLLLTLIPSIASLFAGPTAGAIAAQVGSIVTSVTGVADPHTEDGAASVKVALAGKPELLAELQAKIIEAHLEETKVHAEAAKADADARTAQIVAAVASQDSARQQTVNLVKAGSSIAWGAPLISLAVLASFGTMVWLVMYRTVPPGSENLAMGMVEALKLLSVSVVGYWCGSSAGSARKDDTIANMQPAGGAAPRPLS